MDGRLVGGRYRLLESHAMGGMASVWRATDEQTGDIVAVKLLHPHLVADPGARERLIREAVAMEAIRHPNVVRIRAVVDGDEPALVMDFVEGRSVADMAENGHRFDEAEAVGIAAAVADGLAAAHEQGIVHRDVKPANVLVGDDGTVRLSDFGIAVALDDATALTAEADVVGTLRYLAPERLAGDPATPATDVWGVGTVLYELLAGTAAFPAMTLTERVESASEPAERLADVSDDTWAMIERCLAANPTDRFDDGVDLAAALHRSPGVPPPATTPADPSAATVVMTLPTMAAEPTEVPDAPIGATRDPAPAAVAEPPRRVEPMGTPRRRSWAIGALAGAVILVVATAMATADDGARDGLGTTPSASPQPAATSVATTPSAVEATPIESAEAAKPGKDKGKENGKGKGRGN
jgi:eukaryotic-like serine/threonine-protein kinase